MSSTVLVLVQTRAAGSESAAAVCPVKTPLQYSGLLKINVGTKVQKHKSFNPGYILQVRVV